MLRCIKVIDNISVYSLDNGYSISLGKAYQYDYIAVVGRCRYIYFIYDKESNKLSILNKYKLPILVEDYINDALSDTISELLNLYYCNKDISEVAYELSELLDEYITDERYRGYDTD